MAPTSPRPPPLEPAAAADGGAAGDSRRGGGNGRLKKASVAGAAAARPPLSPTSPLQTREVGEVLELVEKQRRIVEEKRRRLAVIEDYHATVKGQRYLRDPLIAQYELDISFSNATLQRMTDELDKRIGPDEYVDIDYIAKVQQMDYDEIGLAVISMCHEQPSLSRSLYAKIFEDMSTVQAILQNPSTTAALKFEVLLHSSPDVLPDVTDFFYKYLSEGLWDHCAVCLRTHRVTVTPSILMAVCKSASFRLLSLILKECTTGAAARALAKGHFLMMFILHVGRILEGQYVAPPRATFAPFVLKGLKYFPSSPVFPGTCVGVAPDSYDSIFDKVDSRSTQLVVDSAYFTGLATFEVIVDVEYVVANGTRAVVVGWVEEGCKGDCAPGMDDAARSWGFSLEMQPSWLSPDDAPCGELYATRYHAGNAEPLHGVVVPLNDFDVGGTYSVVCSMDFSTMVFTVAVDGRTLPTVFTLTRRVECLHPCVWLERKEDFVDRGVVSVTDRMELMGGGAQGREEVQDDLKASPSPALGHPNVTVQASQSLTASSTRSPLVHPQRSGGGVSERDRAIENRRSRRDTTWALDQGVALLLRHGADSNSAMQITPDLAGLLEKHCARVRWLLDPDRMLGGSFEDPAASRATIATALPLNFCLYMGYDAAAHAIAGCANLHPDAKDAFGNSPLVVAAGRSCLPVMGVLLGRGASPCAVSLNGVTPLKAAVLNHQPLAAFAVLDYIEGLGLLERQDALDHRGKDVMTTTAVFDSVRTGMTDVTKRLINLGANLSIPDADHGYPLFYAARSCAEAVLVMMLHAPGLGRADLDRREATAQKPTLLHLAAIRGMCEASELLLQLGADPNLYMRNGHTPIFSAVAAQHEDVALLLLPRVDDKQLAVRDENGNTLLNVACQHGMTKLITAMRPRLPDISYLPNQDSRTPLYSALVARRIDIAVMLAHHPEAGFEVPDKRGYTPLCLAAEMGILSVVETLIEYGANVAHKTRDGHSPLYLAMQANDPAVALAIVQNGHAGLDLEESKELGTTLAEYAMWRGMEDVARLLINLGAPYDPRREAALRTYGTPLANEVAEMLIKTKSMHSAKSKKSLMSFRKVVSAGTTAVEPAEDDDDDDDDDDEEVRLVVGSGSAELLYVLTPAGRTVAAPFPLPLRHTPSPPVPADASTGDDSDRDSTAMASDPQGSTGDMGGVGPLLATPPRTGMRRGRPHPPPPSSPSPAPSPRRSIAGAGSPSPRHPGRPAAGSPADGGGNGGRRRSRPGGAIVLSPPPDRPECVVQPRGTLIALADAVGRVGLDESSLATSGADRVVADDELTLRTLPATLAVVFAAVSACGAVLVGRRRGRDLAADTEEDVLGTLAFMWTCKLHPPERPRMAYRALRALAEPHTQHDVDGSSMSMPSSMHATPPCALPSLAPSLKRLLTGPRAAVATVHERLPPLNLGPGSHEHTTASGAGEAMASIPGCDSSRVGLLFSPRTCVASDDDSMDARDAFDPLEPLPPENAATEALATTRAKFDWMCSTVGVVCDPARLLNHIFPPDPLWGGRTAAAGAVAEYRAMVDAADQERLAMMASFQTASTPRSPQGRPAKGPRGPLPVTKFPKLPTAGMTASVRSAASGTSNDGDDDVRGSEVVCVPAVEVTAAGMLVADDPLQRFLLMLVSEQDFHRHLHVHQQRLAAGPIDTVATNTLGMQALHVAAVLGHSEAVEALLSAGADPNAAWVDGLTPAMLAVVNGHVPTAKLILSQGKCNAALRTTLQGHSVFTLALVHLPDLVPWMHAHAHPMALTLRADGRSPLAHAIIGGREAPHTRVTERVMDLLLPTASGLAHTSPPIAFDACDSQMFRWMDVLLKHADPSGMRDGKHLLVHVITSLPRGCRQADIDRVAKGMRLCFTHSAAAVVWQWRGARGETMLHHICKRQAVRLLDLLHASISRDLVAARDGCGRQALEYLAPAHEIERSNGVVKLMRRADGRIVQEWLLRHRKALGNRGYVALLMRLSDYPSIELFDKDSVRFSAVVQHFWLAFFTVFWIEGAPLGACFPSLEKIHPLVVKMASPVAVVIFMFLCNTLPVAVPPAHGAPAAPSYPTTPLDVLAKTPLTKPGPTFRRMSTHRRMESFRGPRGGEKDKEKPPPVDDDPKVLMGRFNTLSQHFLAQVVAVWVQEHEVVGRFLELVSRFGHARTLEKFFTDHFAIVGELKTELRARILFAAASTCQATCLEYLLTYDKNSLFTEGVMLKALFETVLNGREMARGDKWRCVDVLLTCRIPLCAGSLTYIEEEQGSLDYRTQLFGDTVLHIASSNGQTEYVDEIIKSEAFSQLLATNVFGYRAIDYAAKDTTWRLLREAEKAGGLQIRAPDYLISYAELQSRMVKHHGQPDALITSFLEHNHYMVNSMWESGFPGSLAIAATAAFLWKHATAMGVKFARSTPPPELHAELARFNACANFLADIDTYHMPPSVRQGVIKDHLHSLRSEVIPFDIPLVPHWTYTKKEHLVTKPRHALGARIEEPTVATHYDFRSRADSLV